jgi:tetratricopeptide (TPR) repeat protein
MKKLVIAFIFFLLQQLVLAQSNLDSMLNLLHHYETEDTTKAFYYTRIGRLYSNFEPDTGLLYADSAVNLSIKLNSVSKLAHAYAVKAFSFSALGNDSAAIRFFKMALTYAKLSNLEAVQATILQNMGISCYNRSDYATALDCYKKALEIYKKIDNKIGISAALNSIGIVLMDKADYPHALEYYFESQKINEQRQDSASIAQGNSNIGILFQKLKDYNKALSYQQKAIDIYTALNDEGGLSRAYNNIANVYDAEDFPEKAIEYYQKALQINLEAKNTFGIASNYNNLGVAYQTMKQFDSAYYYYNEALPLFQSINDESNTALAYEELSTVLLQAPDAFFTSQKIPVKEKYAYSLNFKNNALKIYTKLEDIAGLADVYEGLSEINEKTGNYNEALKNYRQYVLLKDSIFNDENKKLILEKEMGYEFDKKQALENAAHEKEMAVKEAEVSKQKVIRNSTIAGFALIAVSGAGAFVSYKRRHDALQKAKETQQQLEVTETEMKALRAQMNPHFIFNSLNSINDFISKNNPTQAIGYTGKFAKLMRMVLENSEKKEVSLSEDLVVLELYIQLEQLRAQNKFDYKIAVGNSIDKESTLLPPLILQPFVENSIWHGFADIESGGMIEITFNTKENKLLCVVQDNGKGRDKEKSSSSYKKSMGSNITETRINLLNKTENANASIAYADLSNGLRVELSLPYKTMF